MIQLLQPRFVLVGKCVSAGRKVFFTCTNKIFVVMGRSASPLSNQFLNGTNYVSTVDMKKHQCLTNGKMLPLKCNLASTSKLYVFTQTVYLIDYV